MKIIDAHCHLNKSQWVNNTLPVSQNDFLIKKYGSSYSEGGIFVNMQDSGIEKTIIFPMPSQYIDLEQANDYIMSISRKNPDKLIPFATVDFKPEHWYSLGARGMKQHDFGQGICLGDMPNYKKTYTFMQEHNLPLLVHPRNPVIKRVEEIIKYAPDLKIILAHCGAEFPIYNSFQPEFQQVQQVLNAFKSHNNLYFDISALKKLEILEMAIEQAGDKKIIFGSDYPEETPYKALQRLDSLSILENELENILYNNISSILSLNHNVQSTDICHK